MLNNEESVSAMNRLGRAMADTTRSRILLRLLREPCYPAQLATELGLSRTNVSNHLACLRGCGIVAAHTEGRQTRYAIAHESLRSQLLMVIETATIVLACTCKAGETECSCHTGALT